MNKAPKRLQKIVTTGSVEGALWKKIVSLFPPHQRYLEPFAEESSMVGIKNPSPINVYFSDHDPVIQRMASGYSGDPYHLFGVGDWMAALNFFGESRPGDFIYISLPPRLAASEVYLLLKALESEAGHAKVLVRLPSSGAGWSGFNTDVWYPIKLPYMTRWGERRAILFSNYEPPEVPIDLSVIPVNAKTRYALKQRAARFRRTLAALDPIHRAVILEVAKEFIDQENFNLTESE